MKQNRLRFPAMITVAICLVLMAMPVPAKKGKEGREDKRHAAGKGETHIAVDIFIGKDRELIRSYFVDHQGSLPPGLAKRNGRLTPGLEKQLRRNGRLPPGLQKRITPFPVKLEQSLAPLKEGLERGFIEGRAVIYNRKSSAILDVFTVL